MVYFSLYTKHVLLSSQPISLTRIEDTNPTLKNQQRQYTSHKKNTQTKAKNTKKEN